MAAKKKPSAAQLAARAKFVAMVRAKSKAKKSGSQKKVTVKKSAVKKKSIPKKRVVKKRSISGVNYSGLTTALKFRSDIERSINQVSKSITSLKSIPLKNRDIMTKTALLKNEHHLKGLKQSLVLQNRIVKKLM